MIKLLLNEKYSLYVCALHGAIGVLASQNKYILIGWFFFVVLAEIPNFLNPGKELNIYLNHLIVYLTSFEILGRMSKATPFIPYELSKYILCFFFIYGIINQYNRGTIGFLMLTLILPALFYDDSGEASTENLIFNAMGPINLALGIVYFKGQSISQQKLMDLIKLALYPSFGVLAFSIFRTPDYDNIDFTLGAKAVTSGGFGSNQVSTIFGLAVFLMFILWISGKIITSYRTLDAAIILALIFQGLLTFSRGGMLGGMLTILFFLFMLTQRGIRIIGTIKLSFSKMLLYVIPVIFLGLLIFQIANSITNNNLLLRYKGETEGTQVGMKEVDLNTITTNRYEIFVHDYALWQENFLWGIGVGASQYLREGEVDENTAAHVELSRLLAEHGLLGLLFFCSILILPFYIWKQNADTLNRAILMSLFILGLYTSFHAAMRTYVTPLFVSMSLLTIKEKPMSRIKKSKPEAPDKLTT